MKKGKYILLQCTMILTCANIMGQAELEIMISNIRSDKGQILLSLFEKREQFPDNPPQGLNDIVVPKTELTNKTITHNIKNLKPGKFALAILDDENQSGDMDYNKLGLPLEGFGFSNNIKPLFSPPPFNKCLFELKEGENKIKIDVIYR